MSIKLLTYGGNFTASQLLAVAILSRAFGGCETERTLDSSKADGFQGYVFGIGNVNDPNKGRFHYLGDTNKLQRANGKSYGSLGLLWVSVARDCIQKSNLIEDPIKNHASIDYIARYIDDRLIMFTDMAEMGLHSPSYEDGVRINELLESWNVIPMMEDAVKEGDKWVFQSTDDYLKNCNRAFDQAVKYADLWLSRIMKQAASSYLSSEYLKDRQHPFNGLILTMERPCVWEDYAQRTDALGAVFPHNDHWHFQTTVGMEDKGFAIPPELRNVKADKIKEITGLDNVFHSGDNYVCCTDMPSACAFAGWLLEKTGKMPKTEQHQQPQHQPA